MKAKVFSILALVLGFFALPAANAAIIITEPFSSGPLPVGWSAVGGNYDFASSDGKTRLRIYRTGTTGGSEAIYYTGNAVEGGLMQNFSAEVTMRFGGTGVPSTTIRGLVFRTQDTSLSAPSASGFWGYSLGVISVGTEKGLYLFENPTGVTSGGYGTQLAFSALAADLPINTDYTLKLNVDGSLVVASLIGSGNQVLASITFNEAIVTTGYFGFRAANSNSNVNTYYSDLRLEVLPIPEPGSLVLALMAGGAVLAAVGRRSKMS